VVLSSASRACLAMPPPFFPATAFSSMPVASIVSAIWRVERSIPLHSYDRADSAFLDLWCSYGLLRLHPTISNFRSQRLIGSALGLGTDWINRSSVSGSATSVSRILPSLAIIFNWWQFVTVWLPSFVSRSFNLFQYLRAAWKSGCWSNVCHLLPSISVGYNL